MKTKITKAGSLAHSLLNELTEAHSKATEENPLAEILLLDLIKQSVEIRNKLRLIEVSL